MSFRLQQIDQTLSFSEAGTASTVRELILPGNISFQGLKVTFSGFSVGGGGIVSSGINSMRIQVASQSPVQEVVLIESADDIEDYIGLLTNGPVFGDINNMINMKTPLPADGSEVNEVRDFILPWGHCNQTQIKIIVDFDTTVATGAGSTATINFSFINPGVTQTQTAVLSKFAIPTGSITNEIPLPSWGCDEFVIVPDTANALSLIQQTALGLQVNNPKTYFGDWEYYTGQTQPTSAVSGFFNYYFGRSLMPDAGANTINITKSDAGTGGFIRYLRVVPCTTGEGGY